MWANNRYSIRLGGMAILLTLSVFAHGTALSGESTRFAICKNFGCKNTDEVEFSPSHWQKIETLFSVSAASPVQERLVIARAIAETERLVGLMTDTSLDKGGNIDGIGLPGQMDCVDESTNTTAYLHALAGHGLLRWHTVGERAYRRPRVFDQHWSATIKTLGGAQTWTVDSWFLDNGKQPFIQPLEDWKRKAALPYNVDATE
jgi:hypothetical protein